MIEHTTKQVLSHALLAITWHLPVAYNSFYDSQLHTVVLYLEIFNGVSVYLIRCMPSGTTIIDVGIETIQLLILSRVAGSDRGAVLSPHIKKIGQ